MIRRSSSHNVLQTSLSIYQFKSALSRKSAPLPSHHSGVPELNHVTCDFWLNIQVLSVNHMSMLHKKINSLEQGYYSEFLIDES
jgi:hypothetical protein